MLISKFANQSEAHYNLVSVFLLWQVSFIVFIFFSLSMLLVFCLLLLSSWSFFVFSHCIVIFFSANEFGYPFGIFRLTLSSLYICTNCLLLNWLEHINIVWHYVNNIINSQWKWRKEKSSLWIYYYIRKTSSFSNWWI